jgi:hypothetical protein
MNETNINKLNSRLEALEKLCHNLHSELFKIKMNQEKVEDSRIIQKVKVKDLRAGDVVILPDCNGDCRVDSIKKETGYEYRIFFNEYVRSMVYGEEIEVTFLYHKNEEQEIKPKRKKISELKEGDIFQYGKSTSTISRIEDEPSFDSVRLYFYQMGNPATLPKDLEVIVLN